MAVFRRFFDITSRTIRTDLHASEPSDGPDDGLLSGHHRRSINGRDGRNKRPYRNDGEERQGQGQGLQAPTEMGFYSPCFFPSLRSLSRPMSDNTLNAALRRLGYAKDQMTAHGFRALAATLLNEMGIWNPDAIERQLAHADGNSIRRAYARGQYWAERGRMMQHWSDHINQLRSGAKILRPRFGHSAS